MKQVNAIVKKIREFWANAQHRKTVMWVIGTFSIALIAFGGYIAINSHREASDLSDKLDEITNQIDAVVEQYPVVERDGEMTHDLTNASDVDKQYLALLHTRERSTYNERVDAQNERTSGIRLIGVGVIGLAIAYFFAPEAQKQSETVTTSETSSPEDSRYL